MKKVHIITGGASGIGLEAAKRFKDGVVVITGRNLERLNEAKAELLAANVNAEICQSDISSVDSIREMLDFAKSLGTIKTIVNSAGVSGGQANAKMTLTIDLLGSQYLVEEALKDAEEGLVLILIASMVGHLVPDNAHYDDLLVNPKDDNNIDKIVEIVQNDSDNAYNFAKKGVLKLVEKYAFDYGLKGARLVSLSPGIIMTPMGKLAAKEHPEQMNYMNSITPLQRPGEPEDIANVVEFLASDAANFITGSDVKVDGGLVVKLKEPKE